MDVDELVNGIEHDCSMGMAEQRQHIAERRLAIHQKRLESGAVKLG